MKEADGSCTLPPGLQQMTGSYYAAQVVNNQILGGGGGGASLSVSPFANNFQGI